MINEICILCVVVFSSWAELPIEELLKLGVSDHEIEKTLELKGSNGLNGNYLIYREKKEPQRATKVGFFLYNSDGKLIEVIPYQSLLPKIEYFEVGNNKITIVFSYIGLVRIEDNKIGWAKKRLKIIEYSIPDEKITKEFYGMFPCKFSDECDWMIADDKKLSFFTTYRSNNELLEHSMIYEYDWSESLIRETGKAYYSPLDASTGCSFLPKNIVYDYEKKEFTYDYE